GLRSPVQLSEGMTYTVLSEVPYRDRTLLGKADTKYPKEIKDYYLQIPPEIADQVRQKTEAILADYNRQRVSRTEDVRTLNSVYEKTLYLAQYLKQNYSFPENPLGLPHLDQNDDLVESFLFKHQGGYPDHFSTVLTVMLRSIGIPARLVAGFAPGEFNPFTGMYIVKNTDA
ncbi:MAG: transglutaminase-like domain-containing protein, partial [Sphaerospermopsis kisseleviana]